LIVMFVRPFVVVGRDGRSSKDCGARLGGFLAASCEVVEAGPGRLKRLPI
jgi:hypothetical protein